MSDEEMTFEIDDFDMEDDDLDEDDDSSGGAAKVAVWVGAGALAGAGAVWVAKKVGHLLPFRIERKSATKSTPETGVIEITEVPQKEE